MESFESLEDYLKLKYLEINCSTISSSSQLFYFASYSKNTNKSHISFLGVYDPLKDQILSTESNF